MNKYSNKKVTAYGIPFDSKKEAQRYCELRLLEKAGIIKGLELQKEFVLIPAQYEDVPARLERIYAERSFEIKCTKPRGKCLERACKYKADFYYFDVNKGRYIVEDTKGVKTKDYIIKRKLMLYIHGIRIIEL